MADSPPSTSTSTIFPNHQPGYTGPTCDPGHTQEVDWDACTPECQAALDASPTAIPTHFCPKAMRKHKFFDKKPSTAPKGNDPFDYEQKYPEDEKYQELGAMARVWKVFLDECAKYDVEMAEDWRDALDVLLVFAGLFSAVVTTFVSQTSQKLQRDFTEVTAHKMDEMTKLLRVVISGNNITDVPPSSLSIATKFVPERSDLWVNGLWFTSLALSLTTALLAVLTKQWIHQYMSVPSGTPRDRSRIRQFRFNSLEKWRVPVIIGLLPVLMHISLGVFFAGLIVYLLNLDTPMSGVVTFVAVVGFVAYTGTNLLPLFKPDCPYKTPLTLHSHGATVFIWSACRRLIQRWKQIRHSKQKTPATHGNTIVALSLREVEKERVEQVAEEIEAQCLSWLFNISSNSSVQRVVAQALSQVPLKSVKPISENIPGVHDTIRTILLLPEHRMEDNKPVSERLFRALVRFVPDWPPPPVTQLSPTPGSLAFLVNREHSKEAAELLREQIVEPTLKLDVLSWALILQNALITGTSWLSVHHTESDVWQCILARVLGSHQCLSWNNCQQNASILFQLFVSFKSAEFSLEILDLPGTEVPDDFIAAISKHMFPSFHTILWRIAFPSSPLHSFPSIPPDICLQLDLMRCPYIQEGFGFGEEDGETTMTELVKMVQCHLDIQRHAGDTLGLHPNVVQATFPVLCDVIGSDGFVSDSMTSGMKHDVLHALFRTLVEDPNLTRSFSEWAVPSRVTRICDIVFVNAHKHFSSPLITEILEYESGAGSACGLFIAAMYAYLNHRNWLQELQSDNLMGGPDVSHFDTLSYPFLAAEYVDGLPALLRVDSVAYEETLQYLRQPPNTVILSKLLLVANSNRQRSLLKLAAFVGRTDWLKSCRELQDYLLTPDGRNLYTYYANNLRGEHPFRSNLVASHGCYADLEVLLTESLSVFDSTANPLALKSVDGSNPVTTLIKFANHWRTRVADRMVHEGSGESQQIV